MILEFLTNIVLFPIKWFWKKYTSYKEQGNIPMIILLFAVSFTGVIGISFACLKLVDYMFTNHLNLLLFIGVVIWLYLYVRDKNNTPEPPTDSVEIVESIIIQQAEKGYPIMRNIIFQTVKSVAPDIGGRTPRVISEVEVPEDHYIISNSICFYQFRLLKQDLKMHYTDNDLKEFQNILQAFLSHKIQSGDFPQLKMENYRDKYGNWLDSIIIDTIEDVGNMFIIQAVFSSPEYAEYQHQITLSTTASDSSTRTLREDWNDKL